MENKNIFETLTQYRLKVEKDGKSVMDVPGILALPCMLAAPRMSIAGLVAAPLFGMKVHLESKDGQPADIEETVRKAAETVKDTATAAAKTIKEEIDKAWEAVSADDPAEEQEPEKPEASQDASAPEETPAATEEDTVQDIVEDLEKHEEEDVPTIHVNPDNSSKA